MEENAIQTTVCDFSQTFYTFATIYLFLSLFVRSGEIQFLFIEYSLRCAVGTCKTTCLCFRVSVLRENAVHTKISLLVYFVFLLCLGLVFFCCYLCLRTIEPGHMWHYVQSQGWPYFSSLCWLCTKLAAAACDAKDVLRM